jgi:hypothetical protein
VAAHTDPEGPLPVVVAAVTQHVWPAGQSVDFVHPTTTLLEQILKSFGVHVLVDGQQTSGEAHGTVVQSSSSLPGVAVDPAAPPSTTCG